ncbi:MAG: glycosyltransferase family 2 protein [Anaerolineales bacterium]|nr:glycosyltransferase family 2 protein [Anaerolineales bacterium]
MFEQPMVFVIVLAWNQLTETIECLESLLQQSYPNLCVVLADNGSTDGSAEVVTQKFPAVKICRQDVNAGISGGYNLGIEYALRHDCQYIIVMNNDTVADKEMISQLVQAFVDHPKVGMTTPKIYHYYGDRQRIWCVGAKWRPFPPSVKTIGSDAPDGPKFQRYINLEYATSCCLMMSRESLEKVGLFDPGYYLYYDDWDLSTRYRTAGYEILFVPTAHLWHKVSVSTQKTAKKTKPWFFMGKSSARFYLKYKPPVILGLHTAWFALREAAKLRFYRIPPFLFGVASGLADHWGWKS